MISARASRMKTYPLNKVQLGWSIDLIPYIWNLAQQRARFRHKMRFSYSFIQRPVPDVFKEWKQLALIFLPGMYIVLFAPVLYQLNYFVFLMAWILLLDRSTPLFHFANTCIRGGIPLWFTFDSRETIRDIR